jgi:hypothetical protein
MCIWIGVKADLRDCIAEEGESDNHDERKNFGQSFIRSCNVANAKSG